MTDGLLSPQKAHTLAAEFAEYFFAGHQALLVTHIDGNLTALFVFLIHYRLFHIKLPKE